MVEIKVVSVNISEKKGTAKIPVESILLHNTGIAGDAHAGMWHRQVSLLGVESIEKMQPAAGNRLRYGVFAENITTQGFPLYTMHPLDRLIAGNTILEVTQIGKKCHGEKCTIFKEIGDCVMPREGIFCRVIRGGLLKAGDILEYKPKIIKIQIITLSDRVSRGEYEDKSGPLLRQLISDFFLTEQRQVELYYCVIPDDAEMLRSKITQSIREESDLIFTTGGTGIGPRDITPDVVKPMLEKEIPGIMEVIRVKFGMQFSNAMMSRGVAGVIGKTLIYTLPGNPKAVQEYTGEICKTLLHSLHMLHEIDKHG